MRKVVAALIEQRSYKRRYIQIGETLTVGNIRDLIAKKGSSRKEAAKQPVKWGRKERHCRRWGKTRHNTRTCAVEIIESDKSDASKKYY